MEKQKNRGFVPPLVGWIASSILVPVMPELMYGGQVFGYPLAEYMATIGLFSAILLVVWIPVTIFSVKASRKYGIGRSIRNSTIAFGALMILWALIFTFLWNS